MCANMPNRKSVVKHLCPTIGKKMPGWGSGLFRGYRQVVEVWPLETW